MTVAKRQKNWAAPIAADVSGSQSHTTVFVLNVSPTALKKMLGERSRSWGRGIGRERIFFHVYLF